MPRIISASRRTDIPAFYGDWFMRRLKEGFAGYVNPFGGQKYTVSLKPEDVICFVFWSKNFRPFIEKLEVIEDMGYQFYLNYTITGLPEVFEHNSAGKEAALETLKELSSRYSPERVNWRYDPIIISDITGHDFYLKNFESLASSLEGYAERCYFSYAFWYGKVRRSFEKLQSESGINITNPDAGCRIRLANELADIAQRHGIEMLSCCGDYLLGPKIGKAHCVDGKLVEELLCTRFNLSEKPTRKECGCTESVDIGAYDTCPHGCVYCYANMNKHTAELRFQSHDRSAAFLGYTRAESDKWAEEVKSRANGLTLLDYG